MDMVWVGKEHGGDRANNIAHIRGINAISVIFHANFLILKRKVALQVSSSREIV